MDAHWVNHRPGYRCRHGRTSAHAEPGQERNLYLREDHVLHRLAAIAPGQLVSVEREDRSWGEDVSEDQHLPPMPTPFGLSESGLPAPLDRSQVDRRHIPSRLDIATSTQPRHHIDGEPRAATCFHTR
jgi:hypothetical protein